MAKSNDPTHVVTGRVRLSYAHLTRPYTDPRDANAVPKYSVTVLLPKSDRKTKAAIDAAVAAAKQRGRASGKFDAAIPLDKLPSPIWDGDGFRADGYTPFPSECKGHWVFTCSSRLAPDLRDANRAPIMDPTEVYSGMYARVSCDFFPYAAPQRKGIGCGLCHIMKLADGEPFGGRSSADDDFDDDVDDSDPLA